MNEYVIAIDVGGSKIAGGRMNSSKQLEEVVELPTPARCDVDAFLDGLAALIGQLTLPSTPPAAIGVGLPGTVDRELGQCYSAPNLGWRNVAAGPLLRQRLQIPVYLENDANAAAVAEHRLGAGRGFTHLLVITLGTGIGSGLILDGELFRGANGSAGELGHLPLGHSNLMCACGNQGCLETFFSAPALALQASQIWGHPVSARELISMAQDGQSEAISLIASATSHLSEALVGVINLLDLQLIVLGGGLTVLGELIRRPIAETLVGRIMPRPGAPIEVRLAQCGSQAGLIGAGLLAWDGLLS